MAKSRDSREYQKWQKEKAKNEERRERNTIYGSGSGRRPQSRALPPDDLPESFPGTIWRTYDVPRRASWGPAVVLAGVPETRAVIGEGIASSGSVVTAIEQSFGFIARAFESQLEQTSEMIREAISSAMTAQLDRAIMDGIPAGVPVAHSIPVSIAPTFAHDVRFSFSFDGAISDELSRDLASWDIGSTTPDQTSYGIYVNDSTAPPNGTIGSPAQELRIGNARVVFNSTPAAHERMPEYWVLDDDGTVRRTNWAEVREFQKDPNRALIAFQYLDGMYIQTEFFTIDQAGSNTTESGPLLFETFVTGGLLHGYSRKTRTYEEALEVHQSVLIALLSKLRKLRPYRNDFDVDPIDQQAAYVAPENNEWIFETDE